MPSLLTADLLGPPRFAWKGEPLEPGTRKARALLVFLCASGRAVPRARLAELLWGPGALRNLRQELYVLRQLDGADTWLDVDRSVARVHAQTDLDAFSATAGELDPTRWWRGPFAAGLESVGGPAWEEWLTATRQQAERTLERVSLTAARSRLDSGDEEGARELVSGLLQRGRDGEAVQEAAVLVGLATPPAAAQPIDDGLPAQPDARRLLRLAVLCEAPLDATLAGELLELTPLALADTFQSLTDGGWLVDGLPPDQVRREVAQRLAPQARQALHRALADALEGAGAEAHRLAPHREGAGQLNIAATLWRNAARDRGDETSHRGALRCAETTEARGRALVNGARSALARGDLASADWWIAELTAHGSRTQSPENLRTSRVFEARLLAARGRLDEARTTLDRATGLASDGHAEIALARGQVLALSGALDAAQEALTGVLESSDPAHRLAAANALGMVAGTRGDLTEARRMHRAALDLAREAGQRLVAVRLLNNLGATAQRAGDLDEASRAFREADLLASHLGDASTRGPLLYNLAILELSAGRPGAARDPSRTLLELGENHPRSRPLGFRVRSELERAVGRYDEAAAWAARAAPAFEAVGDPDNAAASQFNEALSRWLGTREAAPLQALGPAYDAMEEVRPALRNAAGAELALCLPDPDAVRAVLAELPDSGALVAARLRADLLADATPAPEDLAAIGTTGDAAGLYLDCLGLSLLPERREALTERIAARLRRGSEGLLASQAEAWQRRVAGWKADPTRW